MSIQRAPIPAFYCVYMLRATTQPRKHVYIGSTPHPRRRLRQHNGELGTRSGASKTVRLRPSEFALLVTGFPSKVAALQFEWAWQNAHITRHSRETTSKTGTMNGKIDHLLALLRSQSFQQWPLEIRIFNQQAADHWSKATAKTPVGKPVSTTIMDRQRVLDGTADIDVTYQPLKAQIAKSTALAKASQRTACAVCHESMNHAADLIAVCTIGTCRSVSHLVCLSRHFRAGSATPTTLLPVSGSCPTCRHPMQWADVARDASLRADGQAHIDKLLKPPRGANAAALNEAEDKAEDESDSDSNISAAGLEDDTALARQKQSKASRSESKKRVSATKTTARAKRSRSTSPSASSSKKRSTKLPSVIPDSEDSDIPDIDDLV